MKMFIIGLILGTVIGFIITTVTTVLAINADELNRDPTKEEWKAGYRRRR